MADKHRLEHPEFYLDPKTFARPAFDGQMLSNLFDPESAPLKEKLHSILEGIHSLENLEFLEDLYKLNSQDDLTHEKVHEELKRIESVYIAEGGPKLLNIPESTIKKIRKDPLKSLINYHKAIVEIFQLITNNVSPHVPILKMMDTVIIVNKSSRNLASEMEKLIQIPVVVKPRSSFALFKTRTREEVFIECQNFCKNAQKELLDLANDENKDAGCMRAYTKQKLLILEKLSAGFKEIQLLESRLSQGPKLAPYLEKMILDINELDKNLHRKQNITDRRISAQRDSERSSRSNSFAHRDVSLVIKAEQISARKINLSVTPESTARSLKENGNDRVRHFRNSSRAVPSPRDNNELPGQIENKNNVPSKTRSRR